MKRVNKEDGVKRSAPDLINSTNSSITPRPVKKVEYEIDERVRIYPTEVQNDRSMVIRQAENKGLYDY